MAGTTHPTLLARLRAGDDDVAAWLEFESTYRDLLRRYCVARGLQFADAEDIVQHVFTKLVTGLRRFEYDPERGRFRDYLYRCVRSAIADQRSCPNGASRGVHAAEEDTTPDEASRLFEREWVAHHYRLALAHVRSASNPSHAAVLEGVLGGHPVRTLAQELGMSEEAVYKAKQRMLEQLRERIAWQIASEEGRHG